jgi:hypothetical protein
MKKLMMLTMMAVTLVAITGCDIDPTYQDQQRQRQVGNVLSGAQKTPTDIQYSLERYNLIRRAYWVNGMREKAISLPCPLKKPLGYIVLITQSGAVVGRFIVDGKVSSLGNYLTPVSERAGDGSACSNSWLADVDGTYGDNDKGIFFFTPNGNYMEWAGGGTYLYSDIPFEIKDPIVTMKAVQEVEQ